VTRKARITGTVEYREGEGELMPIPPGMCEFEETELDVTISWTEGDTHGSTAMPQSEFQRFVDSGDIELID
jgi:hypothetical protein